MSKLNDITKIPISVLEVLKNFKKKKSDLYESIPYEKGYIKYKGNGINEDFYFTIEDHKMSQGQIIIDITFSPTSTNVTTASSKKVTISQLETNLSNWTSLLKRYQDLNEEFSENEKFEKRVNEIYEEFEFVSEDEEQFFNIRESILLDETLHKLGVWLDEKKDKFLPVLYEEIKSEIEETQANFQDKQKKWAAKRISKILALIMKQGPRFLKEAVVEIVKAVVVEIIKVRLIG